MSIWTFLGEVTPRMGYRRSNRDDLRMWEQRPDKNMESMRMPNARWGGPGANVLSPKKSGWTPTPSPPWEPRTQIFHRNANKMGRRGKEEGSENKYIHILSTTWWIKNDQEWHVFNCRGWEGSWNLRPTHVLSSYKGAELCIYMLIIIYIILYYKTFVIIV